MNPSQWKQFNFLDIALRLLKFDMNFIFINQKILIYVFDKFDYLFWSTQLYVDEDVFIFCKLNCCIFLNSWPHKEILDIFIINLKVWHERNHCLLFFVLFGSFINRSFSIVLWLSKASIIINVLLGFLQFF